MRRPFRIVKFIVIALVAVTAVSFIVTGLWNWLMPAIFGLHTLSFWQALGLLLLSRLLFGGFRGHRGGGMHWRRRMMERWEQMTPEERERFQAGMRGRCGTNSDQPA